MEAPLNEVEVRVLGCLIEKETTTPEYYPLSLNSLTNACNQKSNRNPVLSYDEETVSGALRGLREKGLSTTVQRADSRTAKYMHSLVERLDLEKGEIAVLCELMLRGPQTVGEIRGRAERMYAFKGIEEADSILRGLMERQEPLVLKLPRLPGRKEPRYAHLMSGMPEAGEEKTPPEEASQRDSRLERLEGEVSALRTELDELKSALSALKSELE